MSLSSYSRRIAALSAVVISLLCAPLAEAAPTLQAKFFSAAGWVKPGDSYSFQVVWEAGSTGASGASVSVTMPPSAIFTSSNPAPSSGNGSSTAPLVYSLGNLAPGSSGKILIRARAMTTTEDPEILWKDLSATAKLTSSLAGVPQPSVTAQTKGPRVTTLSTARYGDRPFPVVMVQYQDIKHCTGVGTPFDECTGNHTAEALDAAVNSKSSGKSLWQLYNDMSFGQLNPIGAVRPAVGSTTKPFDPTYKHKWSTLSPSGTCTGATLSTAAGTPLYANRVENGWYVLPGNQGYYGADKTGHALVGAVSGQAVLLGIDDACGPTGKIVYDAASLADPDLDYNDFDTDKDGVVDFFNLMFAGDGGNGSTTPTGLNNVWPHKSDLRYYYTDGNGETGYVSNDQLKNHEGVPMYWKNAERKEMTTDASSGLPVYVRVGPYNVNPESAVEKMSVIAHEYGHSLGLPDFYSLGSRETMGSWELMGSDYAQYMTVFSRQELGWIVPVEAEDGVYTLRESKKDTGTITAKRPDGTPYTLTGPGIHNADALRVGLPAVKLIDSAPSGTRLWHSGSGNDFGCPGHTLDVFLPELEQYPGATAISVSFKSLYEIEWDWDYGFVQVSTDGGLTWTTLPSKKGTTLSNYNPNNADCYQRNQNGITGVSGEANTLTNTNRHLTAYPEAQWIDDEFDLTQFKGKKAILRFSYFTDAAAAKRGWFIDDINVSIDGRSIYSSNFETDESNRLFPNGFARISSADGVNTDHAYYIELRDRISWDKDGKNQSDRGTPTWAPGVAMLYTDENHGYGNTSADSQPAQTVVDSQPQPGNETPNLDDAAFNASNGKNQFDGCTHIDNYKTATTPTWKLPNGLKLTVSSLSGLSADGVTSNAVATLIADVKPDCTLVVAPPVLRFAPGHTDPEKDGAVELEWTRPAGASGPDEVQEATLLSTLLTDDAEGGLTKWSTTTSGTGAFVWEQSQLKKSSGTYSFWGRTAEGATDASSILTLNDPIAVPAVGNVTLSFSDWYMGEGDDKVAVEVSENGTEWTPVYEGARSALAPDAATAFQSEGLTPQNVSLAAYKGKTVRIRFRFIAGAENRAGSTPLGWYVDDVRIEAANWTTVAEIPATAYVRSGLTTGTYNYRVRTRFGTGAAAIPGPWSNTVTTGVEAAPPPAKKADLVVASIRATNNKGNAASRTTVTAVIGNIGQATSAGSRTTFYVNGAAAATFDTPALAPNGTVAVTFQWDTKGMNGSYTIRVDADSSSNVDEVSESNNSSTATYELKGGKV